MSNSLLNKVLKRGVVNTYPSFEEIKKRLSENPTSLKFYLGIDPTADFLHLGHIVPVRKLEQLRNLGCQIILLIGDFTATIGDPTGKVSQRKALTRKEVKENSKNYLDQVLKVLDIKNKENPVEIMSNSQWWDKMNLEEFLKIAQNSTVQQLLERDMFQERLKAGEPIFSHEFIYPLLQGYDSVAMDVDGEVGGNDQTFNMLFGRSMLKTYLNKDKLVITTKLLTDSSGNKMGKSEGNAVPLDASPKDMFGSIMSWPDEIMEEAFELLTDVDMEEIEKLKTEISARDLKSRLALEITTIFHEEKKALKAQENFDSVFSKKEMPTDMPSMVVEEKKMTAVDLLVETGMATSKSDARRVVEQGGFQIDHKKITDPNEDLKIKKGMVVQRGKRQFVKIK